MSTDKSYMYQSEKDMFDLVSLKNLDRKTQFFGGQAAMIYKSWSGGRHRIVGGEHGSFCYHAMSRTAGGLKLFGDVEKEALRKIFRLMSRFTGVQILTWAVMDNHFHLLLRVPEKTTYLKRFENKVSESGELVVSGEEKLLEHLKILYSKAYVAQVRREIAHMRELGMEEDIQKFLEKYKARFCNMSSFMKEVKERFSRWFNKRSDRKGALWMDRFKSVMVEDGNALRTMAAYIDLNAVRAGVVEDPKDYRWCGYAEAVAGSKVARRGLCQVMQTPQDSWGDKEAEKVNPETGNKETAVNRGSGGWYRCWLMHDGKEVKVEVVNGNYEVKARAGIPEALVDASLQQEGRLTMPDILRCKIRYLSEGIALGGKSFVDEWYEKNRSHYSPRRKTGAKSVPLKTILNHLPEHLAEQKGAKILDSEAMGEAGSFDEEMLDQNIHSVLTNLHSLKGVLSVKLE